jgi:predicted RNA-binding protein with PIN domain
MRDLASEQLKIMPYLVDGHNLIPKLGLRLDSFDDEEVLITRLQEFCRIRRAQVAVYFDGAPAGHLPMRKAGAVTAHFIRLGSSADAAIEVRLARLGKQARNWTVVSSDGRVQAAGRAVHARVLSSEEFSRQISTAAQQAGLPKRESGPSPEEVEEWLSLFKARKG